MVTTVHGLTLVKESYIAEVAATSGLLVVSLPSMQNTYVYVDDIITFTSDTDNNLPTILPTQSLINNNVVVTSNSTTYATI